MGIWNQSHLIWFNLQHKVDEAAGGIAFDIEFGLDQRPELQYIAISDMSLIGTWVYRNPLCSKFLTIHCHFQYIWIVSTARIAQCGDFIDIYT